MRIKKKYMSTYKNRVQVSDIKRGKDGEKVKKWIHQQYHERFPKHWYLGSKASHSSELVEPNISKQHFLSLALMIRLSQDP